MYGKPPFSGSVYVHRTKLEVCLQIWQKPRLPQLKVHAAVWACMSMPPRMVAAGHVEGSLQTLMAASGLTSFLDVFL